jgi:solute carrier family 25 carnitine/acylcarnitine transporter 20/29
METETIDQLEKGGGALRTIKDLAAGAAGGIAQVLLGMCAQVNELRGNAIS